MASYVEKWNAALEEFLYQPGKVDNILTEIEARTGVKRRYIALGAIGFMVTYLIFGYGGQLLCNLIGFVYPAYASFKALETNKKEDDTKWLTYWVVYGFLSTIEFFSDILLSWFPMYWLAKCLLLLWCFAPGEWNGSSIIYKQVVRPLFVRYQSKADAMVRQANTTAAKLIESASHKVQETIAKTIEHETMFKTD